MISMTGYGRASWNDSIFNMEIEIRSINGRYFKFTAKIPQEFNSYEMEIKNIITEQLERGTINFNLNYLDLQDTPTKINVEILKKHYKALEKVAHDLGIAPPSIDSLLTLPEVTTLNNSVEVSPQVWSKTKELLAEALSQLQQMRKKEGETIKNELEEFCDIIKKVVEKIRSYTPSIIQNFKDRIQLRISQFVQNEALVISEQDILKELAIFAEKVDISEELLRLNSHLEQFKANLEKEEPVGRTLDFLSQEMLRESNTIASKANNAECSQHVVEIKNCLEKMREQIQNVE